MTIPASRNRSAFFYMLGGVVAWSFAPLVIDFSGGSVNPFLFNLIWKGSTAAGVLAFLLIRYRSLISQTAVRGLLLRRTYSWSFLLMAVGNLDVLLFIWSIEFIDVAVATIMFELWPLILIIFTLVLFRSSGRFADTTIAIILPLIMAFVGLVFVTLSQGVWSASSIADSNIHALAIGMVLASLAAVCSGGLVALTLRWGAEFRVMLEHSETDVEGSEEAELFGALFIRLVTLAPLLPVHAVIGVGVGDSITSQAVLAGVAGGLIIGAPPAILFRKANLLTTNLGINSIGYATPVFALVWLFLFSRVGVVHPDHLVIGAVAIIAANLLINFQAEIRFGFRSLIIALWGCGAFVYFRGSIAEHLALEGWLWPSGEYFTAVGLAATVFTLILSFRVARLVTRTSDETNRAFALFSRIDLLASRGVIPGDVRGHILRIDAHENAADLADAYRSARASIRGSYEEAGDDADRRELAEAAAELDALAHSRQEGQDFGEYVALVIFAVITVALILLSLDASALGWNGFLAEMFTVLFSAVIIFLVVNVWDLQRERGAPVLRQEGEGGGYGVVFRDAIVRRIEQVVSIVVVLAMSAAYGWLLWGKWLG